MFDRPIRVANGIVCFRQDSGNGDMAKNVLYDKCRNFRRHHLRAAFSLRRTHTALFLRIFRHCRGIIRSLIFKADNFVRQFSYVISAKFCAFVLEANLLRLAVRSSCLSAASAAFFRLNICLGIWDIFGYIEHLIIGAFLFSGAYESPRAAWKNIVES